MTIIQQQPSVPIWTTTSNPPKSCQSEVQPNYFLPPVNSHCIMYVMDKPTNGYQSAMLIRRPETGRDPCSLYYTVSQVAALRGCLGVSVRNAIVSGRLPSWTIGGIYLIPRREAEDWALRANAISGGGKTVKHTERRIAKLQRAAAARALRDGRTVERAHRPSEDASDTPG